MITAIRAKKMDLDQLAKARQGYKEELKKLEFINSKLADHAKIAHTKEIIKFLTREIKTRIDE